MTRPTRADLNLTALRHNVSLVRKLAPAAKIMAVVKANAYGYGAVAIAQGLEPQVDAFAVACLEEAAALRVSKLSLPILLLEGVFDSDEYHTAAQLGLWVCIENEGQLCALEEANLESPLVCWLKVDTGMHRLGIKPTKVQAYLQRLQKCDNVKDEVVVFTHFACADDLDSPYTVQQLKLFDALDINTPRSASNSAGVLAWPQAHYDWVRPGYMLYGISPLEQHHPNAATLQTVMTLRSAVSSLRDVDAGESVGYGAAWIAQRPSRIATVPIGYGDGYPRPAPPGTPVLVNGQRAPLAGRVSMDMITVDVTDLNNVQPGDDVVLWGHDLPLEEIAACANTNGYELTTRMPLRTPRVIIDD